MGKSVRPNFWRSVFVALMVMVMMSVVLSGCGSTKSEPKSEGKPVVQNDASKNITAIKQRGKLIVGTASGYYPFEMVDKDGKLVGFDIDMAKGFAKSLGVEVEFQNYSFAGLIPAIQSKKVDIVLAGMAITEKRKEAIDYTDPYYQAGQAVLVNKDVPGIKNWKDLDKPGNVIAVSLGTVADQVASRDYKQATVKKFEGSALAGLELLNGKATAVIHDGAWVKIYQKRNPDKTYAILKPFTKEDVGAGLPKGTSDVAKAFNDFLKKHKDSGEYQKSYQYWFVDMLWWDNVPQKK